AACRLVFPQPQERWMAQSPVFGAFGISDFRHKIGPDPIRTAPDFCWNTIERSCLARPFLEFVLQILAQIIVKAGAHPPAIDKLSIFLGGQQQGRKTAAPPPGWRPANDDE